MWQAIVAALGTVLGMVGAILMAEVLRERYRQHKTDHDQD